MVFYLVFLPLLTQKKIEKIQKSRDKDGHIEQSIPIN